MTDILVVSESAELAARLAMAAGDDAVRSFPPGSKPIEDAWSASAGFEPAPAVVILDCTTSSETELRRAAHLHESRPAAVVVLIGDDPDALALAGLRAGVYDILAASATPEELGRVLAGAKVLAEVRLRDGWSAGSPEESDPRGHPSVSGRVISVVSPKGGVGKTTVAVNLAVGLARVAPRATVLVDLDIQFGDVASGLNLDPEYFLPSAVHGPASRDAMVLKTFLTLHETGLYVICAPESPAEADSISAAEVARLLRTLAGEFRYVVVDTAPGLSEHTLAAIDESSDLVLLTSMDVPGLRGLRKELDTLDALSLPPQNRQIVVNFADPRIGLSAADIDATIGTGVDIMLPRSKAAPTSINLGVPMLQSGVRDPLTKQLRRLVDHFSGATDNESVRGRRRGFSEKPTRSTPRRAASGWFRRPRVVNA